MVDTVLRRRDLAPLAIGLVLVAAFRSLTAPQVFRDRVYLAGNDPWHYLHWTERALREGIFTVPLAHRDPLTVEVLAVASWLVGGVDAAPFVLAVYPVVSALITGACLYAIAIWLTGDRRLALLSMLFLAVLPASAVRTILGFGDHHAMDFLFLSLTMATLVWLYTDRPRGRGDVAVVILGLCVTAQAHAWGAGALLLAPLGIFLTVASLVDIGERSPLGHHGSVLISLGLAGGLSLLAYPLFVGSPSTGGGAGGSWTFLPEARALFPAGLFLASLTVVVVAEVAHRHDIGTQSAAIGTSVAGIVGLAPVVIAAPNLIFNNLDYLLRGADIAEMASLLSGEGLFGVEYLGALGVVALIGLVLGAVRGVRGQTRWLLCTVYACFFLILAVFKIRLLGEASTILPLFIAVGFLWFAARLGIVDRDGRDLDSLFERETLVPVALLVLIVAIAAVIQGPIFAGELAADDQTVATAEWMADDVDEISPNASRAVVAHWNHAMLYNHIVSGESESYGFSKGRYEEVLEDPCSSRARLEEHGVAYLVVDGDVPDRVPECMGPPAFETTGTTVYTVQNR